MKFSSVFFFIFLASCANSNFKKFDYFNKLEQYFAQQESYKQLSNMQTSLRSRADYNSYLALEYLDFARNFYSMEDKRSANHFAKKGIDAAQGNFIMPENPLDWGASKANIEEMLMMQKRLESVLNDSHMKLQIPIQLAHLTYLYDCWMVRESKDSMAVSEVGYCKTRFSKLLNEIEDYIIESKKDKTVPVQIKPISYKRFEISFDENSLKLNDGAAKNMIDLLNYITNLDDSYHVVIFGNKGEIEKISDKNMSLNRAKVIKEYLIKNGVLENVIEIRNNADDFPDIINNDGELNNSNRKVGIYVLKGVGSVVNSSLPEIKNKVYQDEINEMRKKRGLQ